MNSAHLHLILGHIPIMGAGFTVLLIFFALLKKSKDLKQTSLWFAVITGITALAAYLTGDGAEEVVSTLPGISEVLIEPHEQMALYYLVALLLISTIALAGLFLSQASATVLHKFVIVVLILNLLASYHAVTTGISGGKIRHIEIVISSPDTITDKE